MALEAKEKNELLEKDLESEHAKLAAEGELMAVLYDALRGATHRVLGPEDGPAAAEEEAGAAVDQHEAARNMVRRLERRLEEMTELTEQQAATIRDLLSAGVDLKAAANEGEAGEGPSQEEEQPQQQQQQQEEVGKDEEDTLASVSSDRDKYKAEWDKALLEVQSLPADMAKEIREKEELRREKGDLEEELKQERLNKRSKRKHQMYKEKLEDAGELLKEISLSIPIWYCPYQCL